MSPGQLSPDQELPVAPYFQRTCRLCAAAVVFFGCATLLGWINSWRLVTQFGISGSIPMAPNSAVGFVLLGAAIGLFTLAAVRAWVVWLARVSAGLCLLLAGVRVYELASGTNLESDQWILKTPGGTFQNFPLGQMASQTALGLCTGGLAFLLITASGRSWKLRQAGGYLAAAIVTMGFVFFLGYLYGSPFLGDELNIPMAVNTATAFLFSGVGLVAMVGPEFVLLRPFYGRSIQARLLRAFLPFTALTVCLVAWLMHIVTQESSPSSAALISAMLAVVSLILVGSVCLRIARSVGWQLDLADQELQQAERQARRLAQELYALNESLEKRVTERSAAAEERTRELGRSEQALREQTRILQSLLDNISDGVVVADPAGDFLIFNPAAEAILGLGATEGGPERWPEHYGLFLADKVSPYPSEELPLARALRGEAVDENEIYVRHKGKPEGLYLSVSARPLYDENGKLTGAVAVFRDVTKRRQADAALRTSEERIRMLLDSAAEGIYGIDLQGRCTFINPAAAHMMGCEADDVLGRNMHDFTHHSRLDGSRYPVEECPVFRAFQTGEACRVDNEVFWRCDGSSFSVEYSSHPLIVAGKIQGAVVTFTDITQRKQAEEQLHLKNGLLQEMAESEREAHAALKQAQTQMVQAEKLAALGQLVAGVAHEINNPLSFVSNNVAVLQRDVRALRDLIQLYEETDALLKKESPDLHSRLHELTERIDLPYTLENLDGLMARSRDGLKRIQHIVKDLRDFARLDESDLHEVDLNAGIESTVNIIRGQAKKQDVELQLDLQPLPGVTCYPAKINQVVLNLVANAIDACSAGGAVTISTKSNGESVAVEVADTGSGIDPAVAAKIFDPFFTTKPQGKGTGLGLSISYGIVRAHGGTIQFETQLGKGTRFHIDLPRKYRGEQQDGKTG
ncbi:MAG: PAS domain S-box protein [Gemmataceae bacterium]